MRSAIKACCNEFQQVLVEWPLEGNQDDIEYYIHFYGANAYQTEDEYRWYQFLEWLAFAKLLQKTNVLTAPSRQLDANHSLAQVHCWIRIPSERPYQTSLELVWYSLR